MATPSTTTKKPVIGLTGSIGSGKTVVAEMFASLGCAVIQADRLAHEVLEEEGTKAFLKANFGTEVFDPSGRVDRGKLADEVFGNAIRIRRLEEFIHPEVIHRQEERISQLQNEPNVWGIILEVPLLIESGLKSRCDRVIVVDADLTVRERRVGQSRGWSREELIRREKFFFSIYLKRSLADDIVYNNSTMVKCRQQVESIYSRIISSVSCPLA